ncbi:MAG TPA: 3-phosphoshikimate 1-carboxyvinyltransferase [Nitrospiria bacterium]|nr:3-phosphoshikimate 1-carboxyvinyltransferase [Nitrospiria bacterium]
MSRLLIRPTARLAGEVAVPGDKSITHRAILLAALAEGRTVITGYLPADDCLRSLAAVEALGVPVVKEDSPRPRLRIDGMGADALKEPAALLDLGNSGTSLRLLTGLLAGLPFVSVLTGDASLRRRPMRRVIDPLRRMGAELFAWGGGERAPLVVQGRRPLNAIDAELPVASAQLKSALLLAALSAEGTTRIMEPARSRDHTERMLPQFGARVTVEESGVSLTGPQRLRGAEITVPGDLSSAAFPLVAAAIVPSASVRIPAVGINPTRTGLLELLASMGAKIGMEQPRGASSAFGGEPVADLTSQAAGLRGVTASGSQIVTMIDEFPILCVAAAVAKGETVVRDAQELRVKESDRIAVMAAELRKLGVGVEELPDGVRIAGGASLRGAACHSHGDHRIAMALAVAGLAAQGETMIEDVDCIETSFPGFADLFRRLGADITLEAD